MKTADYPSKPNYSTQNILPIDWVIDSFYQNQVQKLPENSFLNSLIQLVFVAEKKIGNVLNEFAKHSSNILPTEIWFNVPNQDLIQFHFILNNDSFSILNQSELGKKLTIKQSRWNLEKPIVQIIIQSKNQTFFSPKFKKLTTPWHTQAFI